MEPHYHRKIIFLTNQGWNYDTKKSVDQHFLKFDWLALFDIKKKKNLWSIQPYLPNFRIKKEKKVHGGLGCMKSNNKEFKEKLILYLY